MEIVTLSASALLLFSMSILVDKHVKLPYMDEIFHVPQAQKYCEGDYGMIINDFSRILCTLIQLYSIQNLGIVTSPHSPACIYYLLLLHAL